jgi:hypothetical protein
MRTFLPGQKSIQSASESGRLTRPVAGRLLLLGVACLATAGCATTSGTAATTSTSTDTTAYYQSNDNPFHAD